MGKFRLTVFLLVVFINALLCLFYIQPHRTTFASNFLSKVKENGGHSYSLLAGVANTTSGISSSHISTPSNASTTSRPAQLPSSSTHRPPTSVPTEKRLPLTVPRVPRPPLTHPYHYLINPKELCLKSGTKRVPLLIVVCSSVRNFRERQAIRDTWGSASSKTGNTGSVRIVFLLGITSDSEVTKKVQEEAAKHRDVAQENFVDSYQNLTLKSVMMLKWTSEFCPNAQFLLKTDDDMFINVPNLIRAASRLVTKKNLMFGVLFRKASPERNSSAKWYVSESQYPGRVFPDYLSGTAYAMTGDVVKKLYKISLTKPFLIMEDVFVTGICASAGGVKRFLVKGFSHFKRPSTGCAFKDLISGHHVNVIEMHKIWRELRAGTMQCKPPRRIPRRPGLVNFRAAS